VAYSILQPPKSTRYCAVSDEPEGMRNFARPARGDPMKGTYRDVLDLHMSTVLNGQGLQVPDVIDNALGWLLVSDRAKAVIEAGTSEATEYLPFRLINHKGRVAAERVWAVNVLGAVACGDRARSEGMDSPFDEGELFECEVLAIDARKVPKATRIFRVDLYPPLVLVRDDLRRALEKARLQLRFVAPGEPLE